MSNNRYKNKEEMLEAHFKDFLEHEDLKRHPNYEFTESVYKGAREPMTFRCNLHNKEVAVKKAEYLHSVKNRCKECEAEFTDFYQTEKFIQKANIKYNNKFDYSKVEDYHYKKLVTIICPIHGEYKQTPYNHLHTITGCTKCGEATAYSKSKGNRFSKTGYNENSSKSITNVYVIKITGNGESFYKIGITNDTVKERFRGNKLPTEYSIKVEHIFNDLPNNVAYDFEVILHRNNKEYKYKPLIKFAGYTECFTQVPIDLKQYLEVLEQLV